MKIFTDKLALKCILYNADVKFQKSFYILFENALFSCLNRYIIGDGSESYPGGMCVWFPASMNQQFVNIKDVCLNVFNPKTEEPENAIPLLFCGMSKMFVIKKGQQDGETIDLDEKTLDIQGDGRIVPSCSVQSEFHYLPINQTIHL